MAIKKETRQTFAPFQAILTSEQVNELAISTTIEVKFDDHWLFATVIDKDSKSNTITVKYFYKYPIEIEAEAIDCNERRFAIANTFINCSESNNGAMCSCMICHNKKKFICL